MKTNLLIPYEKNAKQHPKKQVQQVADSIKAFGFNQPIVIDKNNVVIVGHGRLEAAKLLGLEDVPVLQVDLTKEQAMAYRLADNKLNESDWDMKLVIEELKGLEPAMIDLTGFDKDLILEPEEKDDDVPEVPKEPKSKLGDLYQLGNHRLLCGDATKIEDVERLMDGQKADMVFTDPPYGVSYTGGLQDSRRGLTGYGRQMIKNDDVDLYEDAVEICSRFSNGVVFMWFADTVCYGLYRGLESVGAKIVALLVWKKKGGYGALGAAYKQNHEPCLIWLPKGKSLGFVGSTGENRVWDIDKEHINKLHPTQKPVALSFRALSNHKAESVLDLFGGSGSTLIAAEKLDRKCYMMELDPKYTDVIIQRWEDYTGETAIKL